MAYRELHLDEMTPEIVERTIREGIEPQLSDVHTLLRLPLPQYGLSGGCNFVAAHTLLAILSGISTTLFAQQGRSGPLFIALLNKVYWPLDPPNGVEIGNASQFLYSEFRNSLTHSIGISIKKVRGERRVLWRETQLEIDKTGGLAEAAIEELERSERRLPNIGTLKKVDNRIILSVEGLYWGVRRTIETLTHNYDLMDQAEKFLSPVFPNSPSPSSA